MVELLTGNVVQGATRFLLLSAILVLVGAEVARVCILPPSTAHDGDWVEEGRGRVHRVERLAVAMLLLVIVARIVQQGTAFADTPAEWTSAVPLILQHTTWGTGWLVQVAAVTLVAIVTPGGRGWRPAARLAGLSGAVLSLSLSGHAVSAPRLTALAVALDAAHVAAAGIWVGTLVVMTATLAPMRHSLPAHALLQLLSRFSPLALASAAVVAGTGTFAGWLHVETLPALWNSAYGRTLALKVLLMALIAAVGAFNWRVATPRLSTTGDRTPLLRAVLVELALALALLIVTASLIVTPLPAEG